MQTSLVQTRIIDDEVESLESELEGEGEDKPKGTRNTRNIYIGTILDALQMATDLALAAE